MYKILSISELASVTSAEGDVNENRISKLT